MNEANNGVMVSAGTYILGDPCYCVSDDKWTELLESCEYFSRPIGNIDKINVLAFSTEYGDGQYPGTVNGRLHFNFPVDSGLIGLVPINLAIKDSNKSFTTVITFADTTFCYKDGAVLHFGSYSIDTNPDATYEDRDD
jgi:hypothetical protein